MTVIYVNAKNCLKLLFFFVLCRRYPTIVILNFTLAPGSKILCNRSQSFDYCQKNLRWKFWENVGSGSYRKQLKEAETMYLSVTPSIHTPPYKYQKLMDILWAHTGTIGCIGLTSHVQLYQGN